MLPDGTYSLDPATGKVCHSEQTAKCITPEVSGTKPVSYTMEIGNGKITTQTIELKTTGQTYEKNGNGWVKVKYAYLWYDGSSIDGPKINEDASSLATTLPSDKKNYLKYKLDNTNKVTNLYACAKFGGKEYCLEGGSSNYYGWDTDAAHSTGNVKVLYDIELANIEGVSCYFGPESYCSDDALITLYANDSGSLSITDLITGVTCGSNVNSSPFCLTY